MWKVILALLASIFFLILDTYLGAKYIKDAIVAFKEGEYFRFGLNVMASVMFMAFLVRWVF